MTSKLGAIALYPNIYNGRRWLQWEVHNNDIYLQEVWMDNNLDESSICFTLNNDVEILDISTFSEYTDNLCCKINVCIVLSDGNTYIVGITDFFNLPQNVSILSPLFDLNNGDSLDLFNCINYVTSNNAFTKANINKNEICEIKVAIWKSQNSLIFGLIDNSLIYINMETSESFVLQSYSSGFAGIQGWLGLSVATEPNECIAISETKFQPSESGLWQLNTILFNQSQSNSPCSLIVSISSLGDVRLWNSDTKKCLNNSSIDAILDRVTSNDDINYVKLQYVEIAKIQTKVISTEFSTFNLLALVAVLCVGIDGSRQWHIIVNIYQIPFAGYGSIVLNSYLCKFDSLSSELLTPTYNYFPTLLDIKFTPNHTGFTSLWKSNQDKKVVTLCEFNATKNEEWINNDAAITKNKLVNINYSLTQFGDPFLSLKSAEILQCLHEHNIGKEFEFLSFADDNVNNLLLFSKKNALRILFYPGRFDVINTIQFVLSENDIANQDNINQISRTEPSYKVLEIGLLAKLVIEHCLRTDNIDDDEDESYLLQHFENNFIAFIESCIQREISIQSEVNCDCLLHYPETIVNFPFHAVVIGSNFSIGMVLKSITNKVNYNDNNSLLENIRQQINQNNDIKENLNFFDRKLHNFFHENKDINIKNTEWIQSSFTNISKQFQNSLTHIISQIQSTVNTDSSCGWLDALFDDYTTPYLFNNEVESLSNGHVNDSIPLLTSTISANVLNNIMKQHIEHNYHNAKVLTILLSIFVYCGEGCLHSSILSKIKHHYLPKIRHIVIYTSFLLWLDSIRPSRVIDLMNVIDMNGLCPVSNVSPKNAIISHNNNVDISIWKLFCQSNVSNIVDLALPNRNKTLKLSEFNNLTDFLNSIENFMKIKCSTLTSDCMSIISKYLMESGEFSTLERWCCILEYGRNKSVNDTLLENNSSLVIEELTTSKIATMKTFSILFDQLRVIHINNSYLKIKEQSEVSTEIALKLKSNVEALLAAAPSINSMDMQHELQNLSRRNNNQEIPLNDCILRSLTDNSALVLLDSLPSIDKNICDLGVYDVLSSIYDLSDINKYPSLFLSLTRISHMIDTMELFKRARVILPSSLGATLALKGSHAIVDSIRDIHKQFYQCLGNDSEEFKSIDNKIKPLLLKEYSKVFEMALEGLFYDEALLVIINILELEGNIKLSTNIIPRSNSISHKRSKKNANTCIWRDCLHALIVNVCDKGNLGWLCSISYQKNIGSIDLNKEFTDILEKLCEGVDDFVLITTNIYDDKKTNRISNINNYYECLCAYLLSHNNFHEAACIMDKFIQRTDNLRRNNSDINLNNPQTRALSVIVHCIGVINSSSQLCLLRSSSNNQSLSVITLRDLAFRFELSSSNISYEDININMNWIDELCNEYKFTQALSISKMADKRNEIEKRNEINTISKSCLQQTISKLSKKIAAYQWERLKNNSSTISDSYATLFKNLVYGSPITRIADPLNMKNTDLLSYQLDIISHLDSSVLQLPLHKDTCFEISTCGKDNIKLKLPSKLVLSYCGSSISCGLPELKMEDGELIENNNTSKAFVNGNPHDLIRLLINRFLKYADVSINNDVDIMSNYLFDAFDISCRLIDIVDDDITIIRSGKSNINLLPYQLFDELFISCDYLLNRNINNLDHNINLRMLHESKIRLMLLIEKHFKRMIINEL